MTEITYKMAGVDIDEGDRFVDIIKPMAKKTFRPEVLTDLGSFGAFFGLASKKYKRPVLVSGTDGVGTKLKIAFLADKHDTVGIDLVAMCVNDILTSGAEPLFFLDYFATGKLKAKKASDVVKGIATGCKDAGCALVGGETAEMPGFYGKDEYDLAGFAVGVVEKEKIVDGRRIKAGDAIIGLESNGLHSNGYSLVRKVLLESKKFSLKKRIPALGATLSEELLRPTKIYVRQMLGLIKFVKVKGMAHITGGGIPGNFPRCLPKGVGALIERSSWPVPPIFDLVREAGNVPLDDMDKTFNMGLGFIFVVSKQDVEKSIRFLRSAGLKPHLIGRIDKRVRGVRYA